MLIIEILFLKFEKFIPLNIPFFQPLNEKMAFHKFSPCKYVANMWKLRNKYRARTMVNATFAYQKTGGYNNEAGRKFVQIHFFVQWVIRPQISPKYELLYWGNFYVGFQLYVILFLHVFSRVYATEQYALWIFMSF